jgi:hypothetical protein
MFSARTIALDMHHRSPHTSVFLIRVTHTPVRRANSVHGLVIDVSRAFNLSQRHSYACTLSLVVSLSLN